MDNPCSSHGLYEFVFNLYYDRINNIYITLDFKLNALYAPIYVVLVSKVVLQNNLESYYAIIESLCYSQTITKL